MGGFHGYTRWLRDRLQRLTDRLRGLNDSNLALFIDRLQEVPLLAESPEPSLRHVAEWVYVNNLERAICGGAPLVRGVLEEPFVITEGSNDKLKIQLTREDASSEIIEVTLEAGSSRYARGIVGDVTVLESNLQARPIFNKPHLVESSGGRVTLFAPNDRRNPLETMELLAVADDAYSTLGLTVGVYSGISPITFDDICDSLFPTLLPLLFEFELVRTAELGWGPIMPRAVEFTVDAPVATRNPVLASPAGTGIEAPGVYRLPIGAEVPEVGTSAPDPVVSTWP
jgi:hypothetical protein